MKPSYDPGVLIVSEIEDWSPKSMLEFIGYEPTETPFVVVMLRIGFAAVLGGLTGLEREMHYQSAAFSPSRRIGFFRPFPSVSIMVRTRSTYSS